MVLCKLHSLKILLNLTFPKFIHKS